MDDEDKTMLKVGLIIALSVIAIIILILALNVYLFQNIPTKVYYKDELIYEGLSAGVDIESGGDTTTIRISGGFLYLFPQKVYTDKGEYFQVEGAK